MWVQRNIAARLRVQFAVEQQKVLLRFSVRPVFQHEMRILGILIRGPFDHKLFLHVISSTTLFSEKCYWRQHVRFYLLYNFYFKSFSFWEELKEIWLKVFISLHVKWPLFFSDFNENLSFLTDFRNIPKYLIS
jgi:hypothetical protein